MSGDLWMTVQMSDIKIGDVLRVKHDAYTGSTATHHNGRLVRVLERRDGDVVVSTIDMKMPYFACTRHAPYNLERKIAQL